MHLKDKDVFNQYYKRSVSGRMLSEKSISDYLEQAFVSKVKLTCGANHVRADYLRTHAHHRQHWQ